MESSVGQSVGTFALFSFLFLTSLRSFRVPLRNPILSSSPSISLIFPLFSSSFHLVSPLFLFSPFLTLLPPSTTLIYPSIHFPPPFSSPSTLSSVEPLPYRYQYRPRLHRLAHATNSGCTPALAIRAPVEPLVDLHYRPIAWRTTTAAASWVDDSARVAAVVW